jgi:DivIVA domain-containing protein
MPTAVNSPSRKIEGARAPARVPARPTFTRARRGYDTTEVDRYVDGLLRRIAAHPEADPTRSIDGQGRRGALEAGTILLDAREAADRIQADAEAAATALVAEAEAEARRLIEEGRADAEKALAVRRDELYRELEDAEVKAKEIRTATVRVKEEVDQWRQAVLQSYEQVAASIEHWPGEVPDPTELDLVLDHAGRGEEEAGT